MEELENNELKTNELVDVETSTNEGLKYAPVF